MAATWGKIAASRPDWTAEPLPGSPGITLRAPGTASQAPSMFQLEFSGGASVGPHHYPGDCLMVVVRGRVDCAGEGAFGPEDIRWCRSGHTSEGITAGSQGATLLFVATAPGADIAWSFGGAAGGKSSCKRVSFADVAFVDFPDAAGRDTQPVQALFTDGPHLLRTRFAPEFMAGEHWHDFDTVYLVLDGAMRFGPQEPWYRTGDLRWVRGGHAYGPEQPGPDGVEFLLLSCGGPVSLHWADLVPAPRGPISA